MTIRNIRCISSSYHPGKRSWKYLLSVLLVFSFAITGSFAQDTLHIRSADSLSGAHDDPDTAADFTEGLKLRAVPDSTVARLKTDPAFAYANDPAYWIKEKKKPPEPNMLEKMIAWLIDLLATKGARIILIVLLVSVLLFIIYRIVYDNRFFLKFRSPGEKEEDPLTGPGKIDLDAALQEAVNARDYRQAVRFTYLLALEQGARAGWIRPSEPATNEMYLRQLAGHAGFDQFRALARAYEYAWFGGFDVDETQWAAVQEIYHSFKNVANR